MALTVPQAGTTAGRAPSLQFEADDTGNVIAAFGQQMLQTGNRLEADRLDRHARRLQVDMTKDLGDLRLRAEEIGDPDELDTFWQKGVADLKQSYLAGRVDRKIAEDWSIAFDDLANRYGNSVGQTALALRQSQRVATFADYEHVAGQQAALVDPGTRDQLYATYDAQVDDMAARGVLTPEAAAEKKRAFRANAESANLTALIAEDPEAVTEGLAAGAWPGLTAEEQAAWKVKAETAVAARAEAAQKAAEVSAKEASEGLAAQLKAAISIAGKGQFSAYEGLLDDPAAIAEHPDLVAQLRETVALRGEGKVIATMPLPELRALSADLGKQELTEDWQTDRKAVVDAQIAAAEKGFAEGADQIAFGRTAGLPVPEIDIEGDPDALARGLAARRAYTGWLVEKGYTEHPALLSEAERAKLAARVADTADPSARLEVALALTSALPPQEAKAIATGANASVGFSRVLGLIADGADPSVALPILRGEQKLATKVASAPPPKQAQMVFNEVTGTTLDGSVPAMSEIYHSAAAIFADGMGETDPEEMADGLLIDGPARTKWVSAIQQAAGATPDRNGEMTVGGFQQVAGRTLLLPRGVAAESANDAILRVDAQLAGHGIYSETATPRVIIQPRVGPAPPAAPPAQDPYRALKAASLKAGAAPDLGDAPSDLWETLRIERIEGPLGQDAYVLVGERRGVPYYIEDADGDTYAFSLGRLVEGARR